MQWMFAKGMAMHGDRRQAVLEAGYSGNDVGLSNRASKLLGNKRVNAAISYLQSERLGVPTGHQILVDLSTIARHGTSDRARLTACKRLLQLEEGAGTTDGDVLAVVVTLLATETAYRIAVAQGIAQSREDFDELIQQAGMPLVESMATLAESDGRSDEDKEIEEWL